MSRQTGSYQPDSLRGRLIALIEEHGRPLSAPELAKMTGETTKRVYQALRNAVMDERLVRIPIGHDKVLFALPVANSAGLALTKPRQWWEV